MFGYFFFFKYLLLLSTGAPGVPGYQGEEINICCDFFKKQFKTDAFLA